MCEHCCGQTCAWCRTITIRMSFCLLARTRKRQQTFKAVSKMSSEEERASDGESAGTEASTMCEACEEKFDIWSDKVKTVKDLTKEEKKLKCKKCDVKRRNCPCRWDGAEASLADHGVEHFPPSHIGSGLIVPSDARKALCCKLVTDSCGFLGKRNRAEPPECVKE